MLDFFKGTVTPGDWMFVGIVIGIAVLLGAGFYFVLYQGQVDTLAAEKKKVAAITESLDVAKYIDSNFGEFEEKMTSMMDLVEKFKDRLPTEREIAPLIGSFEKEGSNLNLTISLDPQNRITDPTKTTFPYKVTVKGDYHDIVSFINLFERSKRYIKVTDIDFKEQQLKDGKPVTEASFTLSTYVFSQDAA